jgi:hypothetical protein
VRFPAILEEVKFREGLMLQLLVCLLVVSFGLSAETWYIRTDGGDRSQCTGRADAPYPGSGTGRPCAFKHPFYLFSRDLPHNQSSEKPSWVISGGDTVIFKNGEYRIGYKENNENGWWNYVGCRGGAYGCYNPTFPAGTPEAPTRFVGEGWDAGCSVKPKLMGGLGVDAVINLKGAVNVNVECLEISDYAQCGASASGTDFCVRSTPPNGFPKSDYASRGVVIDSATNNVTLRNLDIHGLSVNGVQGKVGGVVNAEHVRIAGIQGGGWNMDDGTHTYSTGGTLNLMDVIVEWCGCIEEYPIVNPLPYYKCYDQGHGGYGDGVAILAGAGVTVNVDRSIIRYNVQDGLDALYAKGADPKISVTRSSAYGNGGQQWKFGPLQKVDFYNNLTIANCRRALESFPGIPSTWNLNYTEVCRAVDGVATTVKGGSTVNWYNNTYVGYTSTIFDVQCEWIFEQFDSAGRHKPADNNGPPGTDPTQAPDGARRTFELSYYPVNVSQYEVRVNGARQTIGIVGEKGKQWYWKSDTKTITQDASGTPLTAADNLVVNYSGLGWCDGTTFNYWNNIFRGYTRLDGRVPSVFLLTGFTPDTLLTPATRRNNLICGARSLPTHSSETYLATCPGTWLANEPELTRESDLDALDLRLGAASAARDAGVEIPSVTTDYDGLPRPYGPAYDIGAYEVSPVPASAAPPNVWATAAAQGRVHLWWEAVPGALRYRIQRRLKTGVFESDLATIGAVSYDDNAVAPSTQYCYRVRAESAVNEADWGPEVCAATPAPQSSNAPPVSYIRPRVR